MTSRSPSAWTRRVLARLETAEWRELNPHFRDDYRIAWITVLEASRGAPETAVVATYVVVGLRPEKVWPAIVERRRAKLGPCYADFFAELPPKKPAASERRMAERKAA